LPGGKVETVEQIGNVMLCRYGSIQHPGWVVFKRVTPKSGDPEWQSVVNGKFEDVIKKYRELIR